MARRSGLQLWARSGEVTDPDLDPTHPSGNGGAGKYEHGWIVEKEPHQWANFLYQSQADFQMESGQQGTPSTSFTVNKPKAIAWLNEKQVVLVGSVWQESLSNVDANSFTSTVSIWTNNLTQHKAITWAHGLTAAQVGTYTKTEVNAFSINTAVPNHIAARGNVHNLTATQVGSVSALGGIFTGEVKFPSIKLPQGVYIGENNFGTVGKYFKLYDTDLPLWVKSAFTNNLEEIILDETTFKVVKAKYTPEYIAPEPTSVLLANQTVYSTQTVGDFNFTQGTGSNIDVNAVGLLLDAGNTYLFDDLLYLKNGGTILYTKDGIFFSFTGSITSKDMKAFFGTGIRIRNIRIWPRVLTAKQIAHLQSIPTVIPTQGFSLGFSSGFTIG